MADIESDEEGAVVSVPEVTQQQGIEEPPGNNQYCIF